MYGTTSEKMLCNETQSYDIFIHRALKWQSRHSSFSDPCTSMFQIHLFDIDIPGKITFQESKTLSPGDSCTTFDTRKFIKKMMKL